MSDVLETAQSSLGTSLDNLDWSIIGIFLLVSTLLALIVKGRQAGVRDFFLAGRDLPWVAICASLIATEISAAAYVGVPDRAYTGTLTYLQLAIGAILARCLIAYYFVPELCGEVTLSPYHFVGRRLGFGAEKMTGGLFMIGAVLGQGARVFILASVLSYITDIPVAWWILAVVAFAVLWAAIGGIRTVVWTNVLMFLVFVAAAVGALAYLVTQTTGGLAVILERANEAGKLHVFKADFNQAVGWTVWTAILGGLFNTLASHGADQMNLQGVFCARSPRAAQKAMIWSSLSQVVVLLFLVIGLGMFAFRATHNACLLPDPAAQGATPALPVLIAKIMPAGLKGLLIIGLLAAAISSLDSALAALAQTTVSSFFVEGSHGALSRDERAQVHLSRFFTLLWGAILGLVAWYFQNISQFPDLVELALRSTSFTYGALFGALLFALLPWRRDGRGLMLSAPLALLAAFGIAWHQEWTDWVIYVGLAVVFLAWLYALLHEADRLTTIANHEEYVRRAWYILLAEVPRTFWVVAGAALVWYLHFGEFYESEPSGQMNEIPWMWYLPMGSGITLVLGFLLSRAKPATASTP